MKVERVRYGLWRIDDVLMTAAQAMEIIYKAQEGGVRPLD